jgi:hypothetical protein
LNESISVCKSSFAVQYESNGDVPSCSAKCTDPTQYNYVTDYQFVGGFYGAATPELMMQEIFDNGPISVEFFVYSDFMQYTGGVYVHTQAAVRQAGLNPWEVRVFQFVGRL